MAAFPVLLCNCGNRWQSFNHRNSLYEWQLLENAACDFLDQSISRKFLDFTCGFVIPMASKDVDGIGLTSNIPIQTRRNETPCSP